MSTILPGQSYSRATGLLIEIAPPDGSAEPHFVDSRRQLLSLAEFRQEGHYLSPELEHPLPFEEASGWSIPSQEAFLARGSLDRPHDVFDAVRSLLSRYFEPTEPFDVDLLALFTLTSHLYTTAQALPMLHLVGPPGGGKSRVLELLLRLAFNARIATSTTLAATLRLLARGSGTLLVDENIEGSREMMNVLRAGYRPDGRVFRADGTPFGVTGYRAFGPRVLASNEPLRDPILATRCLAIHCRPASRPVERLRPAVIDPIATELRDRLHQFALSNAEEVAAQIHAGIDVTGRGDRFDEILEPLAAVARLIDAEIRSRPSVEAELAKWAAARRAASEAFEKVHSSDADFAAAVAAFMRAQTPIQPGGPLGPRMYPGPQLAVFLYNHGVTPRLLELSQLGKRLSQLGLTRISRRIEAPELVSRRGTPKPTRVQCTAYDLNKTRAESLAKGERP